MKRLLLMAMAALLLGVGTSWAGPIEDGIAAYESGDYANALKIFRSPAAQGDANAQYGLGLMHAGGQGVAQDYAEAVRWYRLAAQQGYPAVQYWLGVRYYEGQGVAQDYVRAHMWINLGGVSGYPDASRGRDTVEK